MKAVAAAAANLTDYKVGQEIGRGSFATVYKGKHLASKTPVAVKAVTRAKLNKKLLENLGSEISILKGMKHPHIVALLDYRETSSHFFLVMEYCSLGDLSYFIRKRDKISESLPLAASLFERYPSPPGGGLHEDLARHFMRQLAAAIEFLHDRNLVHRDIKPQNLLLSPPKLTEEEAQAAHYAGQWELPVLKLADFGFARFLPSTSLAETLCGSPLYMAPEILRYEKYNAKADLWSVGSVAYEMVVGKPPFKAVNHVELLRVIEESRDHIRFPENSTISPNMKRLIRSLLKKAPTERIGFVEFFNDPVLVDAIPAQNRPLDMSRLDSNLFISEYVEGGLPGAPDMADMGEDTNGTAAGAGTTQADTYEGGLRQTVAAAQQQLVKGEPHRSDSVDDYAAATTIKPVKGATIIDPAETQTQTRTQARTMAQAQAQAHHHHQQQQQQQQRSGDVATANNATTRASPPISSPSPSPSLLLHNRPVLSADAGANNDLAVVTAAKNGRDKIDSGYVVVEKRTVEVNALADELASSPKAVTTTSPAAMARRNSSSSSPIRVMTQASNAQRERRASIGYGTSPTSALARALSMASARLFGTRMDSTGATTKISPPQFAQQMTIPSTIDVDERRVIKQLETLAKRANVVFLFAEVKYAQFVPASAQRGTPPLPTSPSSPTFQDDDHELDDEAALTVAEEALQLFVKTLSLLSKAMERLDGWWKRNQNSGISSRLNELVQWMRDTFNESLDKAEYVQARRDALSKKNIDINVTAEKLLFDRALEMSRAAAVSEMMGEDLDNCSVSYGTALYMLEAILDTDQQDDGLGETDRALVEKFIEHVSHRLSKLHRRLEGNMTASGRPSSLSSSPSTPGGTTTPQIGYEATATATSPQR